MFFTNCKSKYESNTLVKNFKKVESINLDARESNVNNNIFTNIAIEYDRKDDAYVGINELSFNSNTNALQMYRIVEWYRI